MKKCFLIVLTIAVHTFVVAQSVNVHLKSGQQIHYPSSKVDYVDFSDSCATDNSSLFLSDYPDSNTYLDTKVCKILSFNAPSFGWITDSHWGPDDGSYMTGVEGSARKTNILMNYLKKRVNIGKVLFGGDAYTVGLDKYQAANMLSTYSTDFFSFFGKDGVFCIGNHDCNARLYQDTKDANSLVPDTVVYQRTVALMNQEDIVYDEDLLSRLNDMRHDNSTSIYSMSSDVYNNLRAWCKMHYYIDDNKNKIRFIVMESNDEGYTSSITLAIRGFNTAFSIQYDFLAKALMEVPEDYHIVVCAHNMYHFANTSNYGIGPSAMNVGIILSSFKTKSTCSVSGPGASTPILQEIFNYNRVGSSNYDFTKTNNVNKILCLYGHVHYNESWIVQKTNQTDKPTREYRGYSCYSYNPNLNIDDSAILFVSSNADSYFLDKIQTTSNHPDGIIARKTKDTLLTIEEHSFDIISFLDETIEFTRIGAGPDRSFKYK